VLGLSLIASTRDTEQYEVMVRTELPKRKHEGDKEMEKGKIKKQQQQQQESSS